MDDPSLFRIGICAECGTGYPAGRAGPIPKHCARCRERARRAALYQQMRKDRAARFEAERRWGTCADCGQRYERSICDTMSFQCKPCRAAAKREWQARWDAENQDKTYRAKRKWHEANRDRVKAYKHRRRVLARDADADTFTSRDIYERDGWTCQICGKHLDPAVKFPSNDSASIDHIIPISLGGTHTLANVQAACMGCNRRKGGRLSA